MPGQPDGVCAGSNRFAEKVTLDGFYRGRGWVDWLFLEHFIGELVISESIIFLIDKSKLPGSWDILIKE
jgi:hypothetical protein